MPVLEQVLEKYPREVKIVFKNFPLRNHNFAMSAAIAALVADEQGKFWEFHDLLFKDFNRLNAQKIREIVQQLNLDMAKFEKAQKAPQFLSMINRDVSDGKNAGVRGTPTVFINGRVLRNRTLPGFHAMIEKELKRAAQTK